MVEWCAHLGFLLLLPVWTGLLPLATAKYVPLIQPGFLFDYNIPSQPVPITLTQQCETIHITWGRKSAIGQNPTAPYYLQVYTSTDETPFIVPAGDKLAFDWDVPFGPGTIYQICMYDKNGVPGGCQDKYTMIANTTTQTPTCTNVTAPPPLKIDGQVAGGPMSRFGFVDQCTDISITPKAGKPPFTLTVSPSLHPPYNITSNSMDPIVWTVSLSWSFPFFMSLVSADGLMWANGPMHAGGFGPSDCLAPGTIPYKKAQGIAAGAGVGSLVAGVLIGVFGIWFSRWGGERDYPFLNRFATRRSKSDPEKDDASSTISSTPIMRYPGLRGNTFTQSNTSPTASTDMFSNSGTEQTADGGAIPRTYVIHHDGGLAPVTIVASSDTDFVELPPQYAGRGNNGSSSNNSTTGSSSRISTGSQSSSISRPTRSDSLPDTLFEKRQELSVGSPVRP